MVATETRLRRGTAAQCDAMVPASAEVVIDTTNKRPRVGDASTAGGIHVPNAKDIQDRSMTYAVAGGTANALTLTLSPALIEYKDGTTVQFKATADNTASTTINVNGLGAETIRKFVGNSLADLAGGEIVTGKYYTLTHNGTVFILGADSAGGGASGIVKTYATSSGTWTKPSNLVSMTVEVQAPGLNGSGGFAGSGGGYAVKTYQESDLSATESYVIGAAASSSENSTTFKGMTCKNTSSATGGDMNISGQPVYGSNTGGNSHLGLGGVSGSTNGRGYGGGGSGAGGNGAPGIIIFTEYRS